MICKYFLYCTLLVSSIVNASINSESDEASKSKTVLEQEVQAQNHAEEYPNLINLYRPNYVLPFYHTTNPYYAIYFNETPLDQRVKNNELKANFSFLVPIVRRSWNDKPWALNVAYTQLMFWQVYAKSQYFRETNYEPELFFSHYFSKYFDAQIGVNHQSNGRGGYLERSWNRAYLQLKLTGKKWLVQLRGWSLLAETVSSDVHNPNIAYYLGHENVLVSYKLGDLKLSLEAQNLESGLERGFVQVSVSYPILKSISLYGQFFNGYGQSLIEYDNRTTAFGVGVALNDWIN